MSSTCPGQGHRSRPKVNITGLSILVVVFIKTAHKFNVLSVTVSDVTVTRQVCPLLTMITINRSVVPHLVRGCVWVVGGVGVLTITHRYAHFITHTHTRIHTLHSQSILNISLTFFPFLLFLLTHPPSPPHRQLPHPFPAPHPAPVAVSHSLQLILFLFSHFVFIWLLFELDVEIVYNIYISICC